MPIAAVWRQWQCFYPVCAFEFLDPELYVYWTTAFVPVGAMEGMY